MPHKCGGLWSRAEGSGISGGVLRGVRHLPARPISRSSVPHDFTGLTKGARRAGRKNCDRHTMAGADCKSVRKRYCPA